MTCSWCEERFERFLDNDLNPVERARLLAHVDTCAACRSLLEELRVVDALLLQPRTVDPAPNFTFKTMAEVRSMPLPRAARSRIGAYLVCYIVGAWALVAAGLLLAPRPVRALGETALDLARTVVVAAGGVVHVAGHLGDRGELTSWTTLAGGVVVVDLVLALMVLAAIRFAAPRWSGALVNLRIRALLVLLLAVAAFATLRPGAALAHDSDHGKTVLFHDVYIRPDEVIDGDLNVVFGDAQIAGTVRGDVNTLFGRCVKLEGAEIDGEEHCVTDDAARTLAPWLVSAPNVGSFAKQDQQLLVKLGANAIVLLVFLLFPMRMRLALDRVERHPGFAALSGACALIAVIPVAILLLISILGIPLIALEIAGLFAGIWLGTGAVALLVGRHLAELVWPSQTPSPLWALVLGLVVVSAAETVPYVGWAVTALVWTTGLGASLLAFLPGTAVESMRRTTIGGPPMPSRPM